MVAAEAQCPLQGWHRFTGEARGVPAAHIHLLEPGGCHLADGIADKSGTFKRRIMHQHGYLVGGEHCVEFNAAESMLESDLDRCNRIFGRQRAAATMREYARVWPLGHHLHGESPCSAVFRLRRM